MTDYAKIAASVKRTLTRAGADLTFAGPPERTVKAVRAKVITHVIGSSGVNVGDVQFIVAAKSTTPVGEEIDTDPVRGELMNTASESLVVIEIEAIRPADIVVAWYVYGRPG